MSDLIKTDNSKVIAQLESKITELEKEKQTIISCLLDISNQCIGEIAMRYKMDAEMIGNSIYQATGKTNPELAKALKEKENE